MYSYIASILPVAMDRKAHLSERTIAAREDASRQTSRSRTDIAYSRGSMASRTTCASASSTKRVPCSWCVSCGREHALAYQQDCPEQLVAAAWQVDREGLAVRRDERPLLNGGVGCGWQPGGGDETKRTRGRGRVYTAFRFLATGRSYHVDQGVRGAKVTERHERRLLDCVETTLSDGACDAALVSRLVGDPYHRFVKSAVWCPAARVVEDVVRCLREAAGGEVLVQQALVEHEIIIVGAFGGHVGSVGR